MRVFTILVRYGWQHVNGPKYSTCPTKQFFAELLKSRAVARALIGGGGGGGGGGLYSYIRVIPD